jgi:hypothetical protein
MRALAGQIELRGLPDDNEFAERVTQQPVEPAGLRDGHRSKVTF